ncbi:hypothetical protein [Streptomyces mirabilis]
MDDVQPDLSTWQRQLKRTPARVRQRRPVGTGVSGPIGVAKAEQLRPAAGDLERVGEFDSRSA